jgi:hypothetical protein
MEVEDDVSFLRFQLYSLTDIPPESQVILGIGSSPLTVTQLLIRSHSHLILHLIASFGLTPHLRWMDELNDEWMIRTQPTYQSQAYERVK